MNSLQNAINAQPAVPKFLLIPRSPPPFDQYSQIFYGLNNHVISKLISYSSIRLLNQQVIRK